MKYLVSLVFLLLLSCAPTLLRQPLESTGLPFRYDYTVDLYDRADDRFKVELRVSGLADSNDVFNFAAVYPGSYSIKDFGRFVRVFAAYDREGNEIATAQISQNQWRLSAPGEVARIYYEIAETWDTPVPTHPVNEMGGTSLEDDFVLINGPGVFGYLRGLEDAPLRLFLLYPEEWLAGTALAQDTAGFYFADNYATLADSPLLLGNLTRAAKKIRGTDVYVYSYSFTGRVHAGQMLGSVEKVLKSADPFLNGLPAPEYTFLFVFEERAAGALEHLGSSVYVTLDAPYQDVAQRMEDVIAHEYFHVVIPLTVRSELTADFDFLHPRPTAHLWFYEGVTEWASDMMLLRGGAKKLEDFLRLSVRRKLIYETLKDPGVSLEQISLNSYRQPDHYSSVYTKGALTATLLDIRLLELSGGQRGLREVISDLRREYDRRRPFREDELFGRIVDLTHPDIAGFIDHYIRGNTPLPLKAYFEKVGIEYYPEIPSSDGSGEGGVVLAASDSAISVMWLDPEVASMGLQKGDVITALNGDSLHFANYDRFYEETSEMAPGTAYRLTVRRSGEAQELTCRTIPRKIRHGFRVMEFPTPAQKKLRNAWLRNL